MPRKPQRHRAIHADTQELRDEQCRAFLAVRDCLTALAEALRPGVDPRRALAVAGNLRLARDRYANCHRTTDPLPARLAELIRAADALKLALPPGVEQFQPGEERDYRRHADPDPAAVQALDLVDQLLALTDKELGI